MTPPVLNLPPTSHPSACRRSPGLSSCKSLLAIHYTYGNAYVSMLLSHCPTFSFPNCVHSLFSMSASLSLPCT